MEYVCRDIGPNFVIPQFQTESNKEQDWTPISFLFTTHQGEAKVTFNSNKNKKIKNKHKWTKYKKPTKAIIHFSNVSDRIVPMLPIFYHYLSSKSLHFLHKCRINFIFCLEQRKIWVLFQFVLKLFALK